MAITDHSDDVQAFMTDQARTYFARMLSGELSYQTVGFSVGRGGYNPTDPVHILPVDTTTTALSDQVYPDTTGYVGFSEVDKVAISSLVFNCRLPATQIQSNADYGLGEIGIWGKILTSTANPSEIGTVFLYAIGHMPIRCKTRRDVMLMRVVVNY